MNYGAKKMIFYDFYFNIREKMSLIRCCTWLRTGSNPADINLFRSNTGKDLPT